jgi:vacuolar-type H+-ATPase subunit B/Vma2
MSIEDLMSLNKRVVEIVKAKKAALAMEKKDSLSIGEIVSVEHRRLRGAKLEVIKINRTKAILRKVGSLAEFSVPLSMINLK